ncbi:MAG: dicarboxylate/amino acid:cation symporter, partial [Ignavibacteriae bacterium]|nr:dicarboxylate/amino acid:cation symporter [Ignavibacteriota bacterium]
MAFKLSSIKLHNRILLALVFGALFGVIFNISKYQLQITYVDPRGTSVTQTVEDWSSITFYGETNLTEATFGAEDQLKILGYYNNLGKTAKPATVIRVQLRNGQSEEFRNIKSLEKVKTIAVQIKPVGTLFIRLLMFVAIPLVLASLIVGASSLGDVRKVGRIGAKTITIYICTTAIAITVGLLLVNYVEPGTRLGVDAREKLMLGFQGNIQEKIQQGAEIDIVDMLVNIVSTNPISAMANGEMLQIVFFALMVGVSLTLIPKEKAASVVSFFDGFSDLMIQMIHLIMKIAPYGVFALIAATVGEFGFEILQTLGWYAATLVLGLCIHMFIVLGGIVRVFSGLSPLRFFRGLKDVMLIAFSSSSSAATLPV